MFLSTVQCCRWMRSYCGDRRQCDLTFNWEAVACGAPQGSILSPLVFSLNVINIHTSLKNWMFNMYADDLQICMHFKMKLLDKTIKCKSVFQCTLNCFLYRRLYFLKIPGLYCHWSDNIFKANDCRQVILAIGYCGVRLFVERVNESWI